MRLDVLINQFKAERGIGCELRLGTCRCALSVSLHICMQGETVHLMSAVRNQSNRMFKIEF